MSRVADQLFWPTVREVERELYPTVKEMVWERVKATPPRKPESAPLPASVDRASTCDICDGTNRLQRFDGRTLCRPCRRVEAPIAARRKKPAGRVPQGVQLQTKGA